MKVGFNLLLWTPFVTEEHFGILPKLKATGYDGVEVPLFAGDVTHYKKVAKALKDNGLKCTTCTVMPDEEHNPISADPKHRQGAVDYLKWAVDCNAALGSEVLCGPMYQPLGSRFFSGKGPTAEEKDRAAEVHRKAGDFAKGANLQLALECLNRFECYFLNILDDAAAHAKRVNHPNVGIMYDSFHQRRREGPGRLHHTEPPRDPARPHLRERPRHAGQGTRRFQTDHQGAAKGRLRPVVDHRSVRDEPAGTGSDDLRLAGAVGQSGGMLSVRIQDHQRRLGRSRVGLVICPAIMDQQSIR
jgi:hypothetical protein